MSPAVTSVANAAAGMLLPPGLNPFLSPGFALLPGLPGHSPFHPILPGVPVDVSCLPNPPGTPGSGGIVFGPLKHPLTRMPGDPSLSSLKRGATSPIPAILLEDDSSMTP